MRVKRCRLFNVLRGHDHGTTWYLLHGGRVIAALPAPHDPAMRRQVRDQLQAIYRGKNLEDLLSSYEHADGLWLVSAWFRKYPKEMKLTLQPDEALANARDKPHARWRVFEPAGLQK